MGSFGYFSVYLSFQSQSRLRPHPQQLQVTTLAKMTDAQRRMVATRTIHGQLPNATSKAPSVSGPTRLFISPTSVKSTARTTVVRIVEMMVRRRENMPQQCERAAGIAQMSERKARPAAMGWRINTTVRPFKMACAISSCPVSARIAGSII